jgi:uncharacterized protein YndB with AHSA1/START domain
VEKYFEGLTLKSTLKRGAPIEYAWPDGHVAIAGKILEIVPRKKFVHTFAFRHEPKDPPSRVTYLLEPVGRLVKLTLIHDRFRGRTSTYKTVRSGWLRIVSGLKTLLETGKPM